LGTVNAIGTPQHIVCKRSKPPPSTADATCVAIDDATQNRFLCKDNVKVSWLPLAEWVSQKLARKCHILVPDCFVIELEADPGTYMFGSKWEGGAEQYFPGVVGNVTNPDEFSAIFAFDLLIHNVDRHLNNYLYLQLADDTVVKAMDHSRSFWFSGWPLPPPPPDAITMTIKAKAIWTAEAAWSDVSARMVMDRWKAITRDEVIEMIDSAPPDWVQPQNRQDLVDWWGTPEWEHRADQAAGALP